jgi:RNA polymerase sigma factor (sigma-70 family)
MPEHKSISTVSQNGLSEYAQKYLDCLERRRPQLEELLHRIGFSWEVATEAAQDALIEAAKLIQAGTVETIRDRWRWLRTVGIRKARTICRGRWHGWRPLDPNIPAPDPFVADEEDHRYASIRSAFDRLPPHLRELAVFCYIQEHSYREAAEQFNIKLGVVSRRLRRVRDLMRSELCKLPEFSARAGASI